MYLARSVFRIARRCIRVEPSGASEAMKSERPQRYGGLVDRQSIQPISYFQSSHTVQRKTKSRSWSAVYGPDGAAGEGRTPDLVLRRHALYPSELQPRALFIPYATHSHGSSHVALTPAAKIALTRTLLPHTIGVNPSVETVWNWHTCRSMVFPSQTSSSLSG